MRVDINGLSEAELIELNHKIVERLRLLRQARAHVKMMEFRIGERVRFYPSNRGPVVGILTRFNRKSVTVITDHGEHWNVAPNLIESASDATTDAEATDPTLHLVR